MSLNIVFLPFSKLLPEHKAANKIHKLLIDVDDGGR